MTDQKKSAVVFDSPTLKQVRRNSKSYKFNLEQFRKQFNNVEVLCKVYLNAENKVYAGEWLDSKGVVNFNGGWAIGLVKTVEYVD